MKKNKIKRINFGKSDTVAEVPYLLSIQQNSFDKFLQRDIDPEDRENIGLQRVLNEFFPIRDSHYKYKLDFIEYRIGPPRYTDREAKYKGVTYSAPLKILLRLIIYDIEEKGSLTLNNVGEDKDAVIDILSKMGFTKKDAKNIIKSKEPYVILREAKKIECDKYKEQFKKAGADVSVGSYPPNFSLSFIKVGNREKDVLNVLSEIGYTRKEGREIIKSKEPYIILEEEVKEKCEEYRKKLEDAGATVEIIPTDIKEIIEEEVYMGDIPLMTERGTFVINGVERVVISQVHRSPGIYFYEETSGGIGSNKIFTVQIIPYKGSWIEFQIDANDQFTVNLDRKKKFPVTYLLRALGLEENADILEFLFGEPIEKKIPYGKEITEENQSDLIGNVLAEDITDPETGEIIEGALAGSEVDLSLLDSLRGLGIKKIKVCNLNERQKEIVKNTLRKDNSWVQEDREKDKENEKKNKLIGKTPREKALYYMHKLLGGSDPREITPTFINDVLNRIENTYFSENKYNLSEVGRYKINEKMREVFEELGMKMPKQLTLTHDDVLAIVKRMIEMDIEKEWITDDIDHLGNRRLRRVGELLENQFAIAMYKMSKYIQENVLMKGTDDNIKPKDLINVRGISSSIMSFFSTSQLSQFMEQTNPLAEITHKRRMSALGPGGLTRETAGFEVRDVHYSHYGRICPIETPEGQNIGLITSLTTYGKINKMGFIESPYRKVENGRVTNKVVYLSASEEDKYTIAQANARIDENGKFLDKQVLCRRRGEFPFEDPKNIDYMDVSPKQIVSAAASLIPFLEHDDANRALMGSNMQRQAVPLLRAESPVVGTGLEAKIAKDSGAVVLAKRKGEVIYVDANKIIIKPDNLEEDEDNEDNYDVYELITFERTNQNTTILQRPIVNKGDRVRKWQVIADGPATDNGEIALGSNVLVAFLPWYGYNFEDAIVVSERLVKKDKFTSIHIEEFEVEVRETKVGPEELTSEIPNVGEQATKNLDEEGIIRIGAWVKPDDILVGKITPKGEVEELTPEEKLLYAVFKKKASDVKDSSLRVPPGVDGVVVDVRVLSRQPKNKEEIKKKEKQIEREYKYKLSVYRDEVTEKLKDLFNKQTLKADIINKETNRKILSAGAKVTESDIRKLLKYTDIEFPDKFVRNNWEEIKAEFRRYKRALKRLEDDKNISILGEERPDELPNGVIKIVKVFIASERNLTIGDKMAGRHGNKGVIARVVPEEDMPYLEDGTPIDIVLNPLGVPSRMNVGQILETHLGWVAQVLGFKVATPVFEGVTIEKIKELMYDAKKEGKLPYVNEEGKVTLYDGVTGEPFNEKITVGVMYMMKLHHMVDDKLHARAIGPYSLITQQPLGGKAQFGGQRLGEMEVWALEAYGAAYTLQEMLTLKSDDVKGRSKLYEYIVKGQNLPEPGLPASFEVLENELKGLCLNIKRGKLIEPSQSSGKKKSKRKKQ